MRKITTMNWLVVILLALSVVEGSAGAEETIQLEVAKGQSVGSVYYANPEVQVGLYPYSLEYQTTWEKLNQVKDFNSIQAGQYLFPIKAKEVEVPISTTLAVAEETVEPEALNVEEILQMLLAANEEERATLQGEVAGLTTKLEELPKVKGELEQKTAEVKGLELKLSSQDALMAKTTEQHKQQIEGLVKEKENLESLSKLTLPTIPVSTGYAIASGVVIVGLIVVIVSLFRKVSQLSGDRLRLQNNLEYIPRQMEKEFAERIERITRELNGQKRKTGQMRRLLEPYYYAFYCPKISRVGAREDLGDEIFFPIENWMEDNTPLVRIDGIEELVPATREMIEGAIKSKDHQSTERPYLLPNMPKAPPVQRLELAVAAG